MTVLIRWRNESSTSYPNFKITKIDHAFVILKEVKTGCSSEEDGVTIVINLNEVKFIKEYHE